jgi:hypothetical protein
MTTLRYGKYIYNNQVQIKPSVSKKSPVFSLLGENRILLKEKHVGEYNRAKMEKLLRAKNPIRCRLMKKDTVMFCRIV